MLNWKPRRENDAPVPGEIARGLQDARIDSVARQVKRFRRPLFLTFHHEPEDGVGVYGGVDDYADVRRVVARFRRRSVRNVAFVWNVMGSNEPLRGVPLRAMPGDDVVDWVAWDPYNWVDCHGRDGDWIEFADKIRTFYRWLRVHGHADKPFMLGEYGSDEPLAGQPTGGRGSCAPATL